MPLRNFFRYTRTKRAVSGRFMTRDVRSVVAKDVPVLQITGEYVPPPFGPNLVPNGTFDNDIAGWSNYSTNPSLIRWDSAGKRLSLLTTGATARAETVVTGLTIGKTYRLVFDVVLGGSTAVAALVGSNSGGGQMINGSYSPSGQYIQTFVAQSTTVYLRFNQFNTNTETLLDNIVIQEVY